MKEDETLNLTAISSFAIEYPNTYTTIKLE